LIEIAEQVGMTHAGVLHHFGSKEALLIAVLKHRDAEDLEPLDGHQVPEGIELFRHLCTTALVNTQREGLVQTYAAITGESVTENHPARGFVQERFTALRQIIEDAFTVVCGPDMDEDLRRHAAVAIVGLMDGIQLQWLLDKDDVDLPDATSFAIESIVAAAIAGSDRPRALAQAPASL
jgi:AcrR family transcriptional regulator